MRLNQVFRSSLLLCVSALAVNADSSAMRITWNEFSMRMTPRHTIRMVLPDGTRIEGKPLQVTPDGISAQVTRTSNKKDHPKGSATIPRDSVSVVQVRSTRRAGRLIGTLIPLAAGAALAIGGAGANEEAHTYLLFGSAIMGVAAAGGFVVGQAIDRRFEQFIIIPERR